jgi:hypothetical protein
MISVKEAVVSAMTFAQSTLEPPRNSDLRLEEVEVGDFRGKQVWQITLSMPRAFSPADMLHLRRDYKAFMVDRETGEVLSMKIRELAESQ